MARSSSSKPEDFERWASAKIGDTQTTLKNIVDVAVTEGATAMREITLNNGTNNDWGAFWPSRAFGRKSSSTRARVDTGEMLNSIDSKILDSSPTKASGEFGWTKNQQEYFIYQDQGFRHWITGEWIYGMEALRNAYSHSVYVLQTELRKAFK